jgi:hypothetical protein
MRKKLDRTVAITSRLRAGIRNPRILAVAVAAVAVATIPAWYAADQHASGRPTSAGVSWCDRHLQAAGLDPDHHLTLFTGGRSEAHAEIWSQGFNLQLCLTDGHGAGVIDAVDPAPGGAVALPSRAVILDTSGTFGTGAVTAYSTGFSGADVRGLTVTSGGRTAAAEIQNGRWLAWWPIADKKAAKDATVTITYTNGTSTSGPLAKIAPYAS